VIVRGREIMLVDGEEEEVEAGVAVLIPPGAEHAIRNAAGELLEYVSATAPPFPAHVAGDTWAPGHRQRPTDGSN